MLLTLNFLKFNESCCFLQYLKIMRPYPVCFSSSRKHPWAFIYFWILVYPFHTAHGYNDEWVTGMLIPGVRVARCWTLWNFGSLSKVTMSPPVFAVKKPRVRFFKTSMVNSLITLEVYPEFCLQFCYNLAIYIFKRTKFV